MKFRTTAAAAVLSVGIIQSCGEAQFFGYNDRTASSRRSTPAVEAPAEAPVREAAVESNDQAQDAAAQSDQRSCAAPAPNTPGQSTPGQNLPAQAARPETPTCAGPVDLQLNHQQGR